MSWHWRTWERQKNAPSPQGVHVPILGICECLVTLHGTAAVRMVRWRDYSGLSRWSPSNHDPLTADTLLDGFKRWEGRRERDRKHYRCWAAVAGLEGKGRRQRLAVGRPRSLEEGTQPSLILAQRNPGQTFRLQVSKITNLFILSHWVWDKVCITSIEKSLVFLSLLSTVKWPNCLFIFLLNCCKN